MAPSYRTNLKGTVKKAKKCFSLFSACFGSMPEDCVKVYGTGFARGGARKKTAAFFRERFREPGLFSGERKKNELEC
jgi:hypothetical protein